MNAQPTAETFDMYEKVIFYGNDVHMQWSTEDGPQALLCGPLRPAGVTASPSSRVTCRKCRDRALAIVGGEESPR